MTVRVLDFEDRSLSRARQQARSSRPAHRHVYVETVPSGGEAQKLRAVAPTVPEALKNARADCPADARIVGHETLIEPARTTVEVSAVDEESAASSASSRFDSTASVATVRVQMAGRRGFLGIGKRLTVFVVEVHQPAVVELTFESSARIRVEIEDVPDRARCQVCGNADGALNEFEDDGWFACGPRCGVKAAEVALVSLQAPLLKAKEMLRGTSSWSTFSAARWTPPARVLCRAWRRSST